MRARLPLLLASAALVVALLGSTPLGEAAGRIVLPRGSVGTAQLQAGAVTAAKVKDRSLLARDFKPGQLPRGEPGPPGRSRESPPVATSRARIRAPELAAGAVSGVEVSDGSLRLADTAVLSGQVRVNSPQVAAHACVSLSGAVAGVKPYDRTLVLPTQNLSAGLFVTQIFNTNAAGRILFRVCNATAKALDPPLGGWAYVVWRQ